MWETQAWVVVDEERTGDVKDEDRVSPTKPTKPLLIANKHKEQGAYPLKHSLHWPTKQVNVRKQAVEK